MRSIIKLDWIGVVPSHWNVLRLKEAVFLNHDTKAPGFFNDETDVDFIPAIERSF